MRSFWGRTRAPARTRVRPCSGASRGCSPRRGLRSSTRPTPTTRFASPTCWAFWPTRACWPAWPPGEQRAARPTRCS
uniref:Uncharacterized protein n=1 Tax=Human herpesvirus 2 TaxID=10310 RepID=A0A481TX79_HHV2|nr:hypothetical protein [Human alphaherpesvirus 2]QBH85292.1 hypothetical protein [Human alphaherpesvirus 2]